MNTQELIEKFLAERHASMANSYTVLLGVGPMTVTVRFETDPGVTLKDEQAAKVVKKWLLTQDNMSEMETLGVWSSKVR